QFFRRIVLCVFPVLLAAWVTSVAWQRTSEGEPGGFKLGVDLVGGTILVYEIDTRKKQEQAKDSKDVVKDVDPQGDAYRLAQKLKQRIDPNDLFNIVIRPAGGENRVEIILPTGGSHRANKAEKAWADLLAKIQAQWPEVGQLEVPRGRTQELIDRVHQRRLEKVWKGQIFGN